MEVIKFRFIFETKEGKYVYVYLTIQQLMTDCYNQELHKLVAKYGEIKLVAKNQYTGLLDKNEKEIYMGDIFKHWLFPPHSNPYPIKNIMNTIEWKEGQMYTGWNITKKGARRVEVIGNICENRRLIYQLIIK